MDSFGVGESLITSQVAHRYSAACISWRLVEAWMESSANKIKVSESIDKITNPGFKTLYRLYANDTGKAIADYITLHDEEIDDEPAADHL